MSNRIAQPPLEDDATPTLRTPQPAVAMGSRRGSAIGAGVGILLLAALSALATSSSSKVS